MVIPMSALSGCGAGQAAAANTLYVELGAGPGGDREVCVDDVTITA